VGREGVGTGTVSDVSENGFALANVPGEPLPEMGETIRLSVVIRPDVVLAASGRVVHVDAAGRVGVTLTDLALADALILREYAAGRGAL